MIADLLKVSYYYDRFTKEHIKDKGYDEKTVLPMMKNGRTFQYACITFLCKINYGVFTYETIAGLLNIYIKQKKNSEHWLLLIT